MKRSELFFSFLLVPLDFLMILLAGLTAYNVRFAEFTTEIRPAIFELPFGGYMKVVAVVAVLWLIIFALAGLYNIRGPKNLIKEFYRITLACSTGLVLIVVLIFLRRELFDSRFIVLAGFLFAIIYISLARALVRLLERHLYKYDIGVHKVVLVGSSKTADNLISEFSRRRQGGYAVVKRLRDFSIETAQELEEFLKIKEADEVIQSDPNLSKAEILRLFDFADSHHLVFKYAADLLDTKVLKTEVSEIAGIPIVEVKETPLDGWGRIVKRFFDIAGALFLIVLTSPLLLLTALALKLDSRGPVFYKNERVGKSGESFKLLKFRSMQIQFCTGGEYDRDQSALAYESELIKQRNVKENAPVYKIGNDPRLTRVGKFIRRWSIDELPQFLNVLAGSMSLVGPRPHQPREVEKYERHHQKVMSIKPGITGMAQISGRSDLSFEEEVKLDTYYIENWSMLLDLTILLRTPLAVIRHREAE